MSGHYETILFRVPTRQGKVRENEKNALKMSEKSQKKIDTVQYGMVGRLSAKALLGKVMGKYVQPFMRNSWKNQEKYLPTSVGTLLQITMDHM